jgi:hypothetical protein
LVDTDLLALVAGQTIDPRAIRPASITGYWRTGVVGRGYPILLRRAGGHVEGIVVLGLSRRARTRLATYEGSNYRLMPATVESGGRTVSAVVFMFVGSGSGLRSDLRSWSLDRWRRRWKRRALRRADRLSRRPNDAD